MKEEMEALQSGQHMTRRTLVGRAALAAVAPWLLESLPALAQSQTDRTALLEKMKPDKYAFVTNMNYKGAEVGDLNRMATLIETGEFMLADHVKYFANFANGGQIAYRNSAGALIPSSSGAPIQWMKAPGLSPITGGFFLSVRKTGKYSLQRIGQGHVTKPHAILDKSLTPPRYAEALDDLKRFETQTPPLKARLVLSVAHKATVTDVSVSPVLDKEMQETITGVELDFKELTRRIREHLKAANGLDPSQGSKFCGLVGWWVKVEVRDATGKWVALEVPVADAKPRKVGIPLGFLTLGPLVGANAKYKEGVPKSFKETPNTEAYTGDYDLHDVYFGTASTNQRAFVSTPRTNVVTATPTAQPGETEYDAFARLLNWSIHRDRIKAGGGALFDGYANMVQHGAQNTYYAFVKSLATSTTAEKETLVESLLSWDKDILFFTNDRCIHAFSMQTPAEAAVLKQFHQMHNLANCVAFPDKAPIWSNNELLARLK